MRAMFLLCAGGLCVVRINKNIVRVRPKQRKYYAGDARINKNIVRVTPEQQKYYAGYARINN